jgi:hypothetical protein
MNSSTVILALWLGATAWGQGVPQKQQANPPAAARSKAAPASSLTASSPKPPASGATKAATGAPAVRNANVQPAKAQPRKASHSKPVPHASVRRHVGHENAAKTPAETAGKHGVKGQRDPFVSPVVDRGNLQVACVGSGRQCLVVGEISLHGVVRSPSGFIAVVVNGEHTYFLHENDPLADGAVERITKDSIILRERYFDSFGHQVTREVTRKLGVPAV